VGGGKSPLAGKFQRITQARDCRLRGGSRCLVTRSQRRAQSNCDRSEASSVLPTVWPPHTRASLSLVWLWHPCITTGERCRYYSATASAKANTLEKQGMGNHRWPAL